LLDVTVVLPAHGSVQSERVVAVEVDADALGEHAPVLAPVLAGVEDVL